MGIIYCETLENVLDIPRERRKKKGGVGCKRGGRLIRLMMMMIMILMMIRKERISERYRAVGYFMHIDCVLQSVCVRARAVEVV